MIIGKSKSRLAFKEDKRQKKAKIIILCPREVTDHFMDDALSIMAAIHYRRCFLEKAASKYLTTM